MMALMVQVTLLSRMAGPGGNFSPGAVIWVGEPVADQLVAGGFALRIDPLPPVVEEATKTPPEKAVIRRRSSRSRKEATGRDNEKD